jgi:hypothetical protein
MDNGILGGVSMDITSYLLGKQVDETKIDEIYVEEDK